MSVSTLFVMQNPPGADTGAAGDSVRAVGDTLGAAVGMLRDTLTPPPLPGGVAETVRFLMSVPQWIQIGGVVVGGLVALAAVYLLWQKRDREVGWLRTRSREIQFTLAGGALIALFVAGFAGIKSWNYMQHDNGFCTGCHVMEKPFARFQIGAGKHDTLQCHNCHQQSIFASTRQLVLWVANRPTEIGKHAPVPNTRCESCHSLEGPKTKKWEHVRNLAGHRVHFDSDSLPLKDLQCVTCHGQEVHKFIPSARTCQQSGCHEKQGIKLNKMTDLAEINCAVCHAFRKDLPALATDSAARQALVPAVGQCTACHQMKARLPNYRVERDPHDGTCGACHDVHAHRTPEDARGSCDKCHANLEKSPFHAGPSHKRVAKQCLTCHEPHAASVDASDCVGCHTQARKRGNVKPPLPFDTMSVVRTRVSAVHAPVLTAPIEEPMPPRGKGDVPPEEDPPPGPSVASAVPIIPSAPVDTFPHSRHTSLACITCHTLSGAGGKLVFAVPRGCDLCHHQALYRGTLEPKACAACHTTAKIEGPRVALMSVQGPEHPPRVREVRFAHGQHAATVQCVDCHRPPNAMPTDSVRRCQGCHVPHHTVGRDCATCHAAATSQAVVRAVHVRQTHSACDKCHRATVINALVPNRTFCVTCHEAQRNHKPAGECSTCHFLQSPAEYRFHLMTAGDAQ